MCRDSDVQRLTFDSYLHKQMAQMPLTSGLKILGKMWFNFARFSVPGLHPDRHAIGRQQRGCVNEGRGTGVGDRQ